MEEFVIWFINTFGERIVELIGIVVLGCIAYIYDNHCKNEVIRSVVRSCVRAAEQMYKDLDGGQKFQIVVKNVTEILDKRHINVDAQELEMLIEEFCLDLVHTFTDEAPQFVTGPVCNEDMEE